MQGMQGMRAERVQGYAEHESTNILYDVGERWGRGACPCPCPCPYPCPISGHAAGESRRAARESIEAGDGREYGPGGGAIFFGAERRCHGGRIVHRRAVRVRQSQRDARLCVTGEFGRQHWKRGGCVAARCHRDSRAHARCYSRRRDTGAAERVFRCSNTTAIRDTAMDAHVRTTGCHSASSWTAHGRGRLGLRGMQQRYGGMVVGAPEITTPQSDTTVISPLKTQTRTTGCRWQDVVGSRRVDLENAKEQLCGSLTRARG
ncbi:hypothetical protein DFH06DRAFT_1169402 [Mycena polygramma]|nr:hypothetical protein DFH06DRAFT_1169402 [Mycena polygramma]